jgi:hypothetical protein
MATKKVNMASKKIYAEYIIVQPQKDKRQKNIKCSVCSWQQSVRKDKKRKNI